MATRTRKNSPSVLSRRLATQKIGTQAAAAAMPSNPLKAGDHGLDAGRAPQAGRPIDPLDAVDAASTVTENEASPKLGSGEAPSGYSPGTARNTSHPSHPRPVARRRSSAARRAAAARAWS